MAHIRSTFHFGVKRPQRMTSISDKTPDHRVHGFQGKTGSGKKDAHIIIYVLSERASQVKLNPVLLYMYIMCAYYIYA